jgi:hypothetical protein
LIFSKPLLCQLNFSRMSFAFSPHFDPSKEAFLFSISLVKIGAARSRLAAAFGPPLGPVPPQREIAQVHKGADCGSARASEHRLPTAALSNLELKATLS